MGLFSKKEKSCCCSCTNKSISEGEKLKNEMGIKVLGSGCAKCNALEKSVKEALAQLNIDENIDHVTDFSQIALFGVMSTPALVIDGKVVCYGKVLNKNEAIDIIKKARNITNQ